MTSILKKKSLLLFYKQRSAPNSMIGECIIKETWESKKPICASSHITCYYTHKKRGIQIAHILDNMEGFMTGIWNYTPIQFVRKWMYDLN